MTNAESTTDSAHHIEARRNSEVDPGVVRAGAAVAARRRELDISQRSLAADGIMNAGALIAFEKGRSWPRERTRAKLEEVLQWPPGTIARIRRGEFASGPRAAAPVSSNDEQPLIAEAIVTAVNSLDLVVDTLPPVEDPEFARRVTPILSDLRSLEKVAARATHISAVTPALIKALSTVRGRYDALMLQAASASGATLGQRLYAARRRANLSISETAQGAGVAEDTIVNAESDQELTASAAQAIETFVAQVDWA